MRNADCGIGDFKSEIRIPHSAILCTVGDAAAEGGDKKQGDERFGADVAEVVEGFN